MEAIRSELNAVGGTPIRVEPDTIAFHPGPVVTEVVAIVTKAQFVGYQLKVHWSKHIGSLVVTPPPNSRAFFSLDPLFTDAITREAQTMLSRLHRRSLAQCLGDLKTEVSTVTVDLTNGSARYGAWVNTSFGEIGPYPPDESIVEAVQRELEGLVRDRLIEMALDALE
jgi:hypothetical protein